MKEALLLLCCLPYTSDTANPSALFFWTIMLPFLTPSPWVLSHLHPISVTTSEPQSQTLRTTSAASLQVIFITGATESSPPLPTVPILQYDRIPPWSYRWNFEHRSCTRRSAWRCLPWRRRCYSLWRVISCTQYTHTFCNHYTHQPVLASILS